MGERLNEIKYAIEDKMKDICGEITPDKWLIIILIILFIATVANLYITYKAVCNLGKKNNKEMIKIEHINPLDIDNKSEVDTTKVLNIQENE